MHEDHKTRTQIRDRTFQRSPPYHPQSGRTGRGADPSCAAGSAGRRNRRELRDHQRAGHHSGQPFVEHPADGVHRTGQQVCRKAHLRGRSGTHPDRHDQSGAQDLSGRLEQAAQIRRLPDHEDLPADRPRRSRGRGDRLLHDRGVRAVYARAAPHGSARQRNDQKRRMALQPEMHTLLCRQSAAGGRKRARHRGLEAHHRQMP